MKSDDPWVVRITVDEISGGGSTGMTLVKGRQAHYYDKGVGEGIGGGSAVDYLAIAKVILAGEGIGTGLQKGSKVEIGRVVGIKAPLWEIIIHEEKWLVGVDWKVMI